MSALDRIKTDTVRGDLFGGLTAAVVSLPMALTFGAVSGAGPQAGLTGAVLVGLFAALFGGSRTLISEPTGPMTVVMTAVITRVVATNPEHGLATAFTVVMVAGIFQMILGALKLGRYITLMPYSVISGFMSGIGVLLILTQIAPMLGHPPPAGGAVGLIAALPRLLASIELREVLLAAVSLLLLFAIPRRLRRIVPPPLLAVVVGTVIAVIVLPEGGYRAIGTIPTGLPEVVVPRFTLGRVTQILIDGGILAVLGAIDSLLTAMIADSLTRERHDSNRELIGQGLGNLFSGLFGGLPGAGATMGTVVNIQSGARSPVAGIIRSVVLLVAVLALAPMLSVIPMAVLAGIAVKVGVDILDWSFLGRAHRISTSATVVMYMVLAMTVLVDLIVAVGVGVFVANVLTIERLSNLPSTRVTTVDPAGEPILTEEERRILEAAGGQIVLFHLSGPMIFGVAQAIAREHAAMDQRGKILIVDLSDVSMLGTTVALALENVIRDASAADKPVYVAGATADTRERLRRIGVFDSGVVERDSRGEALSEAAARLAPTE
ncbi:MAG TPA: SulP family inorganic anion transporter [Alkalispirochaeta sp.]|nr:SulP family inorganic anion transporter [Alkalispirochaeta sp.]